MRVVIVGAGIAGASAAVALRARLGASAELVLLERGPRAGGGINHQEIAGVPVGTGATLFHSSNRLLIGYARDLRLPIKDLSASPQTVGIWDGRTFVFRTSGSRVGDAVRMLARYQLSPIRASRMVAGMVSRLEAVYDRLQAGAAWDTLAALLNELGLEQLCHEHAAGVSQAHRLSARFVSEFADGVSRNNYGQEADTLSGFAELVSLAGAGLGGGGLRRITTGNRRICEGLIEKAHAQLRPNAPVRSIARDGTRYTVALHRSEAVAADAVVLAAPLELAGISLPAGTASTPARNYKTIHVTFAAGRADPARFRRRRLPDFLLTSHGAGNMLSIERIGETAAGEGLYKAFSLEPLADQAVETLFHPSHVTRITWQAYPELRPTARWAPFRLAGGLYYPSAMEHAVSTMETQAIAGTAVANLLAADTIGR